MSFSAKKGLPSSFLPILAATAIAAGVIIWLNLHIVILAVVVTAPLLFYFNLVKRSIVKQPDYNAIDSVYYFGFSLTIVTLATSAIIHFGLSSDIEDLQNLNLVFSQFGVGLLVTCLGLILRLFLLASLNQQNADQEQNERQALIHDIIDLRKEITGFAKELEEINIHLKNQQKMLNLEIIDSLKAATSIFAEQSVHVQNSLIEHQKQKNLELMQYQEQLQKNLYQQMHDLNDTLYENMQQTNEAHLNYVNDSEKYLVDLAKNVGESIQALQLHEIAHTAKKAASGLSSAFNSMEHRVEDFNLHMDEMTKNYTLISEKHQQQLYSTMQSTKASVDAVNHALTEVAKNTAEHMQNSHKKKLSDQVAG